MRYWIALLCLTLAAAEDPAALSERAQQSAQQQRFDEAERLWKRAIELSPHYFPALFNLGLFYTRQRKFPEAELFLKRAAQASPGDFNAWYMWGSALSTLGRSDDALRAWREALSLQPRNLRLMQVMSVEYYKGRYFGEAAKLAGRALEINGNDWNGMFLAIKAYQVAGDDKTASEIARRAVESFPDSARANFEYAYHLQKEGQIAEAEQHLQRAMKADPSYEEPFFFYGNLLVDQDRAEEAIPFLEKAIQNRHDYVPARVVLARALMNLKKWPEAIAELNETVALDPKHPQPHLLLSQIYFRMGDEAKARLEKEISLRLRRENPTILEAAQGRPFPGAAGK